MVVVFEKSSAAALDFQDQYQVKFYAKKVYLFRYHSPHSRIFPAYPHFCPVFQFLFDCPSQSPLVSCI
jgi:hypothetical protein